MLVKCPSCTTTYRVSDELLTGPTPAFRCSRCKHTFELDLEAPPQTPQAASDPASAPVQDDQGEELAFTFGPQEQEPEWDDTREQKQASRPSAEFQSPEEFDEERQESEHWSMPATAQQEEPFTMAEQDALPERKEPLVPDEHPPEPKATDTTPPPPNNNVSVLEPYRDHQASTLPFLTLFALLTLFFSMAAAFQYAYPEALDRWIKKIPIVGAAVVKNNHLKDGVALKSLRGSHHVIQGNREVFLVTGVATNQNSVVIREVRIGAETYSPDDKLVEEQQMWIGNAISPKIIRGMTAQDILDLQRLKPLKTFEIPPGDSVPFTIVFLKPVKAVKNFTCKVVSAEEEV